MPRKTRIRPGSISARKISPLGAVRSQRGFSKPDANNSTLNPAGATGHTFSGRATRSAPFSADFVANGSGRSFTVILRVVPGFSYRKSVNGAAGEGSLIAAPVAARAGAEAGVAAAFPDARAST